jgi:hypothetical protein
MLGVSGAAEEELGLGVGRLNPGVEVELLQAVSKTAVRSVRRAGRIGGNATVIGGDYT